MIKKILTKYILQDILKYVTKITKRISEFFLDKKQATQKEKRHADIPFQHLAPIDSVDDSATFDALDYALSQQNIHNIAVTGNYGSGKSSVLASYAKRRLKGKCLNISLATFAMEEANDADSPSQQDAKKPDEALPETTVQKIEKSILQQIFYRNHGGKFPYSRFSRIKKIPFWKKCLMEVAVLPLLLFPLKLFKTDAWTKVRDALFVSPANRGMQFGDGWKSFVLGWLFVAAFLVAVYKIISLASRIRLTKFSFQKTEFGLDDVKEESLLNRYIDEILYFFEETRCEVVVIEDLDRFKNTEIFIKLRELNTLLNNYEKMARKIVFVYALRDEVFKDSSRTKFFEFIIPVIPVINCQNASDILLNIKSENPESILKDIDENLLQDAGLYIDDMRLLKNCVNEFIIYDRKINADDYRHDTDKNAICHNRNKILALIMYKNLYPEDFASLAHNEGELFGIFKKKGDIIQKRIKEIADEIPSLESEISAIESQSDLDIAELRLVYIAKIASKKQAGDYIKNNLQEFVSDEKFAALKRNTSFPSYYTQRDYYNPIRSNSIPYDFRAIEKEVNPQYTYDDREQAIRDRKSGKVSKLKDQIARKKTLIASMPQMTMEELLKEIPVAEFTCDVKDINADFIIFLLRNGYIDENYFDYMSYFYPGAISQTDRQYLLLIKNRRNPELNLPLNKPENVVKRIRNEEWKLPAVLNYAMLDHLLESKDGHLEYFIRAFYEYKAARPNFAFLSQYRNVQQMRYFYAELYKVFSQHENWPNILFAGECKDSVYDFFVSVDVDASQDTYTGFLSSDVSFLHRSVESDIVGNKIKALHLKFDLTEETADYPIFPILLRCNAYNISRNNFDILLRALDKEIQETPITDYYTRVSRLPEKSVKEYAIKNIESFANNVMLCGSGAVSESEESFIELLNLDPLPDDIKRELIERNSRKISDMTRMTHTNMQPRLLNENKVAPTWKNIMECFKNNENRLEESLIHFINDEANADELAKERPLTDEEVDGKSGNHAIVQAFYREILPCEDLSLAAYSKIMDVCPWHYKSLSAYNVSAEKMKFLIEERKISLTKENYAGMKKNHPQLLPAFVSGRFSDFIKNDLNLETTGEDMLAFLDSDELTFEQKTQLLSAGFAVWKTMTDSSSLAKIGKTMIKIRFSGNFAVPINSIISSMENIADKIGIMELQHRNMMPEDIARIVASLGAEYAALIEKKGRCPKIEKTPENEKLAKVLEAKGLVSSTALKGYKIEIHQRKK